MIIIVVISRVAQALLNGGRRLPQGSGMRWTGLTRALVVRIDVRIVIATLAADNEPRSAAKRR